MEKIKVVIVRNPPIRVEVVGFKRPFPVLVIQEEKPILCLGPYKSRKKALGIQNEIERGILR